MTRHFLTLNDLSADELGGLIQRAIELKTGWVNGERPEPLRNRTVAMVFEKTSTRTRVSFETAVTHFGGNTIFLSPGDSQLERGEPAEDTARVLSGMVDAIVLRTKIHGTQEVFANYASIPVINGLSDRFHPCQILADIQTYSEIHGDIKDSTVAWIGDGNNVCHSWINAARLFSFHLRIATPPNYQPDKEIVSAAGDWVTLTHDPNSAVADANIVTTDTWVSMGQESEKQQRCQEFAGFCVDQALLDKAHPDALFMHCLPAYRGLEVSSEVIDGEQSVVWQQAANRLHAQKSLLEFLLAS